MINKIEEKRTILSMLNNMKLNPLDPANIDTQTLYDMKNGASVIFGEYANVYKDAEFEIALIINNDPFTLGFTEGSYNQNNNGQITGLDSMKKIQIAAKAFRSNFRLAQTVVHELFHYIDHKSGMVMFFYNAYGSNISRGIIEYRAYNFTFSVGGINQMNGLINNNQYGNY